MIVQSLEGRVAVVTGASRGLGQSIAETLAAKGATLALCARSEAEVTRFGRSIESKYGVHVHAAKADVSEQESASAFVKAAHEALGRIDILVNNAAVMGPVGPLDVIDVADWMEVMGVNVVGLVNVTAACLPVMKSQGCGSIINVSGGGTGGPGVPPHLTAYTTSKAAVASLTETLAREFDPHQIRVNAIAPGPTGRGLMEPVLEAGPQLAGAELYEATLKQREAPDALDRFGELLVYLASDRSAWLTGRLLSARWETIEILEELREQIQTSSLFTMRRIDDALYTELSREPAAG